MKHKHIHKKNTLYKLYKDKVIGTYEEKGLTFVSLPFSDLFHCFRMSPHLGANQHMLVAGDEKATQAIAGPEIQRGHPQVCWTCWQSVGHIATGSIDTLWLFNS